MDDPRPSFQDSLVIGGTVDCVCESQAWCKVVDCGLVEWPPWRSQSQCRKIANALNGKRRQTVAGTTTGQRIVVPSHAICHRQPSLGPPSVLKVPGVVHDG